MKSYTKSHCDGQPPGGSPADTAEAKWSGGQFGGGRLTEEHARGGLVGGLAGLAHFDCCLRIDCYRALADFFLRSGFWFCGRVWPAGWAREVEEGC